MLDALRKHADKIEGSTLYITLYPDNKDAQLIRELGIKEVVYGENKYCKKIFAQASKKLLEGIKRRQVIVCTCVHVHKSVLIHALSHISIGKLSEHFQLSRTYTLLFVCMYVGLFV